MPLLFANPKNRFSRLDAHIDMYCVMLRISYFVPYLRIPQEVQDG